MTLSQSPAVAPADTGWNFSEGDQIAPELTAVRLLGGGTSFEAWLAFDQITFGTVVVKVVRPHLVDQASTVATLAAEVDALVRSVHPVVVRMLRSDLSGPRPHLVLEHVEGPHLGRLIRRYGRLSEQQYLPLALDLASALHYFGHIDLCHLDIKPSNLIMGSPARLIDLSVARRRAVANKITGVIGTDAYLAPEQADPGGRYGVPDRASDVWGVGATLYHAITGRRPFSRGDLKSSVATDRHPQLIERPAKPRVRVAPEVVDVVFACLEHDPAQRPSPREIAGALEPVLVRQPAPRLTFKVKR